MSNSPVWPSDGELAYNKEWAFLQFSIATLSFYTMQSLISQIENGNHSQLPFTNIDLSQCFFKENRDISGKIGHVELQIKITEEQYTELLKFQPNKKLYGMGRQKQYAFVGTCVTLFDDDSGECKIEKYSDVTDFGQKWEASSSKCKEDFINATIPENEVVEKTKEHQCSYWKDEDRDVWFLYDHDEDIHYFFT